MKNSIREVIAGAAFLGLTGSVLAAETASKFPEACRSAGAMTPAAHGGVDANMKDFQRASMDGMMKMDRDMSQGMMKDKPDVAFMCGMIAHHQGAIDMANVELKYGSNDWAKNLVKRIIKEQTKEIAEMADWVKKNAK
jgi:uncharacterized protein (DUF305 family)